MRTRWKLGLIGWITVSVFGTGTTGAAVHAVIHAVTRAPQAQAVSAAPVANGSETAFFTAVLRDIGAPPSSANLRALDLWLHREYASGWPGGAKNNPLDSTQYEPGAWAFNTFNGSEHVWNYPDATEGARATAATLGNGRYGLIVADLRAGGGLCDSRLASEFSAWSGYGYSGLC